MMINPTSHATCSPQELIPEFFLPQGDFLLNLQNLPLGVRQSGTAVDPVELPPWVAGVVPPGAGRGPPAAPTSSSSPSPESFLAIHRAALESPHVSRNLHRWIDLIFGSKQRGLAAGEIDESIQGDLMRGGTTGAHPQKAITSWVTHPACNYLSSSRVCEPIT